MSGTTPAAALRLPTSHSPLRSPSHPPAAGFTLEREEAVPPEQSHPGRGGKEALLIFRR